MNRAPRKNQQYVSTVVDAALVDRLQRARSNPSVSVLVTTTPAAILTSRDAVRLHRLVDVACRRLRSEPDQELATALAKRVRHLTVAVRRSSTTRAMALFVSEDHCEVVYLPAAVADRVVIDPTFATRDLVRLLADHPRYRLVALSDHGARLFEGRPGELAEITTGQFPITLRSTPEHNDRGRRFGRDRSSGRDAALRAHLRAVDHFLSSRMAHDPLPLILAGVSRQVATFRQVTRRETSIIGTIAGNHDRSSPARLDALARPIIENHRDHERATGAASLDDSAHSRRLAKGIDAVWVAARNGQIEALYVEDGFTFAARLAHDGRCLSAASDAEHPDVLDDAVDEAIEYVNASHGRTVIVDDGSLIAHKRIAALLRT